MDSENSTLLGLLQSVSLTTVVQEEIERLIMTGQLKMGARIVESTLARRLNTSRGPVREALRTLTEAGLLRIEKGKGTFVREISIEEVDEIYELREALEEVVGRRVAVRISGDGIERLKAMVKAMRQAAEKHEVAQYAHLNLQFHEMLLDAAGSRKLSETYHRLIKELSVFRLHALDSGGGIDVSAVEHNAIVDAIVSRDPESAAEALRKHVADSRARMHKALAKETPDSISGTAFSFQKS